MTCWNCRHPEALHNAYGVRWCRWTHPNGWIFCKCIHYEPLIKERVA